MNKTLIKEIFDTDFDSKYQMSDLGTFKIRRASRGIVVNGNKVALLNVTKYKYRKLPGGGIEKGETIEEAFMREALEETGCNCKVVDYGGIVVEWRDQFKLLQISYVFLAKAIGKIGLTKFEPDEIDEGYELEWAPFGQVEEVLTKNTPMDYEGKFITVRDKSIILFYKDRLMRL